MTRWRAVCTWCGILNRNPNWLLIQGPRRMLLHGLRRAVRGFYADL